jgi:hypothetical protein
LRAAAGRFCSQSLLGHNHRNNVIIADNKSAPKETVMPGLLFSRNSATAAGGFKWTPEKEPKGPVSIIISGADRAAYVYRNGVEIGRTPVSGAEGDVCRA